MPYTKVLIHFIWSRKNRENLITKELKPLLLQHIKENSIKKGIFIGMVGKVIGYILNQEMHHKKKTYSEEYAEFLNAHNFEDILG
jgi:hypothetical protein